MRIPFYKYQGTGNDFILLHGKAAEHTYTTEQIQALCHRKLGIGADGLILLKQHPAYDFALHYYNADGTSAMCANGCRCAIHLAKHLGWVDQQATFGALDGVHEAYIKGEEVTLHMSDVASIQELADGYFLNTGTPHFVKLVTSLAHVDVQGEGRTIRHRAAFQPEGTNVNFVVLQKDHTMAMRTYEKGVEAETLSCGTGAVAAALVAAQQGWQSPISVATQGGKLQVRFQKKDLQTFQHITLTGPAKRVFEGYVMLDLLP